MGLVAIGVYTSGSYYNLLYPFVLYVIVKALQRVLYGKYSTKRVGEKRYI